MFTLEACLTSFTDSLIAHAVLAVYLFVIMDVREWRMLKKLPALLLSPLLITILKAGLYALASHQVIFRYCVSSFAILLLCTLWIRWAWRIRFWQALAATCMAGVFQVAASCLSQILFLNSELRFAAVMATYWIVVPTSAYLLYRLHFGRWFRLFLEEGFDRRRTALFLFALEAAMETFMILQVGIRPEYLVSYYMLVLSTRIKFGRRAFLPRERAGDWDCPATSGFWRTIPTRPRPQAGRTACLSRN